MKSFGYGTAMRRLPAALMILGTVLLIAACSSGGNGGGVGDPAVPGGDMAQMAESPMAESPIAELGEWNAPMAGALDVSDANGVLDVHYDGDVGHIEVGMPVQPDITGTATWSGMWSGRVELDQNPLTVAGLRAFGAEPEDFEGLGGGAQVTAYLEGDGVTAVLTYRDIPLADIGVTQLSSDRVSVTNGRFEPVRMETVMFDAETPDPTDPTAPTTTTMATVTGDFIRRRRVWRSGRRRRRRIRRGVESTSNTGGGQQYHRHVAVGVFRVPGRQLAHSQGQFPQHNRALREPALVRG